MLTYLPLCLNKISRTWCFSCLSTEASLRVGWQGTLCYWDMSAVEKGRRQRQRPFVDLYGASNHGWSVQGNEVHTRQIGCWGIPRQTRRGDMGGLQLLE